MHESSGESSSDQDMASDSQLCSDTGSSDDDAHWRSVHFQFCSESNTATDFECVALYVCLLIVLSERRGVYRHPPQ